MPLGWRTHRGGERIERLLRGEEATTTEKGDNNSVQKLYKTGPGETDRVTNVFGK